MSELIAKSLDTLLIKNDVDAAVDYVKKVISDLLCDRVDMSKLIITKELSKERYASKQPHAELAIKLRKRDPGSAPKLGDRVSFVICAGSKKELASTRAEDPVFALDNSLPLDTDYYLNNQINKPVVRIFEAILGGEAKAKKILFQGSHMTNKRINNSKVGPMAKFVVVKSSCLECNVVLTVKDSNVLCNFCKENAKDIFEKEKNKLTDLEKKCDNIWDECIKCQGTKNMAVICSNRDCGIFFSRRKIKHDVETHKKRVEKFLDLDW